MAGYQWGTAGHVLPGPGRLYLRDPDADPTDTSTAIGPTFVQDWFNHITGRYGTAEQGGVAFYNLDNEPMLWNDTHRDVYPSPLNYHGLCDRTYSYAAAIADFSGQCAFTKSNLKSNVSSVTFTVSDVVLSEYTYDPGANHNPGSATISVNRPS